jgi:hypothetical protein
LSWLVPAIQPHCLKDASNIAPLCAKRLGGFFFLLDRLSQFRRAENVDDRVKPGHDVF